MSSNKGYVRLNNDPTSSNTFVHDAFQQQEQIMRDQDDSLERVGASLSTLKHMTHKIGDELEEQSEMLDDLGTAMLHTETRMDSVMKKIAKLTRMEDESRQCTAILVLIGLIIILLFLLVVL